MRKRPRFDHSASVGRSRSPRAQQPAGAGAAASKTGAGDGVATGDTATLKSGACTQRALPVMGHGPDVSTDMDPVPMRALEDSEEEAVEAAAGPTAEVVESRKCRDGSMEYRVVHFDASGVQVGQPEWQSPSRMTSTCADATAIIGAFELRQAAKWARARQMASRRG